MEQLRKNHYSKLNNQKNTNFLKRKTDKSTRFTRNYHRPFLFEYSSSKLGAQVYQKNVVTNKAHLLRSTHFPLSSEPQGARYTPTPVTKRALALPPVTCSNHPDLENPTRPSAFHSLLNSKAMSTASVVSSHISVLEDYIQY